MHGLQLEKDGKAMCLEENLSGRRSLALLGERERVSLSLIPPISKISCGTAEVRIYPRSYPENPVHPVFFISMIYATVSSLYRSIV